MSVNAVAISFILKPFTLENISVNVPELAAATRFIELPKAFVAGPIWPDLDAESVLHVAEPLAFVHCAVFENDVTAFLYHLPL